MAAPETTRLTRASRVAWLRGIYAIVNEGAPDPIALAQAALEAGVRVVQYRAKNRIVERHLRELRRITRERGALLVLNDDPRTAVAFDCDGVHLGPDDPGFRDPAATRAILGERIVGLSCATASEARTAEKGGADYVGIGAVYATASKADAGAPIGLEGLRAVASACRLPAAAIGGITVATVADVARTGVAMAAVISAIAGDPDPAAAAAALVRTWNAAAP